jgi:hypothetical protein
MTGLVAASRDRTMQTVFQNLAPPAALLDSGGSPAHRR